MADNVDDIAFRLTDELDEPTYIVVQATHHRTVMEEACLMAQLLQPTPQEKHLVAVDHGAVDHDDG